MLFLSNHSFFLTADKAEKYIASLNNSGLDTTAITYKAKHGFDKPESSNFDEPSHKQSLEKTYQFLNKHLN